MKENVFFKKIRLLVNLLNGFYLIWITSYDDDDPHCHFLFIVYLLCVKPVLDTLPLLSHLFLTANYEVGWSPFNR